MQLQRHLAGRGLHDLAKRVANVAKSRHAEAHPDLRLVDELTAALAGSAAPSPQYQPMSDDEVDEDTNSKLR